MDNKFYVSFEAARLLEEKGYDRDVRNFYDEEGLFLEVEGFYNFEYLTNEELENNHYAAPTKSEAIDWLESKGVIVDVDYYPNREKWSADICRKSGWAYMNIGKYYLTRLEAEEAAIIKALAG